MSKNKSDYRPRLDGKKFHWESLIKRVKHLGLKNSVDLLYGASSMTDEEIVSENIKLARQKQAHQDKNRIANKSFRESSRIISAIQALHEAMYERLAAIPMKTKRKPYKIEVSSGIIVLQISDAHMNELIDVQTNKFDFKIASKRFQLLAHEVKQYAKWKKTNKLKIAFGGDLINSDRRVDEKLSMATNRANATLLAIELLLLFLDDLADEMNITCSSVTGNESRTGDELGWSYMLATDNYDTIIYGALSILYKDDARFTFMPMAANEVLFSAHGKNFLSVHGHQLKGNVQKSVQELIGKFSNRGVVVDYVLAGHIHSAYVSDYFSRNSSICGSNAYSEEALNFVSKASQNMHYVEQTGRIHSTKIDLQEVGDIPGYDIDDNCNCYHAKSLSKTKQLTVIHQVVI